MADISRTDRKGVLGRWRPVLYYTWVASSIVIAAVLLIGGPMVAPDGGFAPSLLGYLPIRRP